MFTVYCPRHDATVLIWPSGLDAVININPGIVLAFHCACGWRGLSAVTPAGRTPVDGAPDGGTAQRRRPGATRRSGQ
jgi:hypothetical protein